MGRKIKDISDKKFGKITVLSLFGINSDGASLWNCICECGNKKIIRSNCLLSGQTKSCGCLQKEVATIHGGRKTRLYSCWRGIKARCLNPNSPNYKNYMGRGISFCKEWEEFLPFMEWSLSNGYKDNLTIDRIDNEGNYSPENCRWTSSKVQCNNRRNNIFISIGDNTKTISQWSDYSGINKSTIKRRYTHGITGEDLLNPVQKRES